MFGQSSKRRRIKPFARPTSFDYNLRYDIRQYQDVKYNHVAQPYFNTANTDDSFRVMEGEILMNLKNQRKYSDRELHAFSFANGLAGNAATEENPRMQALTDGEDNVDQAARRNILSQLNYVGVAVTEFHPARDVYEQGFVATIAGLNTLYNNGNSVIYPGEQVCATLPETRAAPGANRGGRALQGGVPREKLQFVVTSLKNMRAEYPGFPCERFIMGTAISYARPGDNIDIILHRINYDVRTRGGGGDGGGNLFGGDGGGGGRGGFEEGGDLEDDQNKGMEKETKKKTKKKNKSKVTDA